MKNEVFYYNHSIFRSPDLKFTPHAHNTYELILFISGDASYNVEDRKYKLQKFDLLITRPKQYHFVELNSNADYERYDILIYPSSSIAANLAAIPADTEVINVSNNKIITESFKKMAIYANSFQESDFYQLMLCLLTEITLNLKIIKKNEFLMPVYVSPLIKESLSYINDYLFKIKDISEISNHLFIAKNYFFRLFKDQMKISPKKYIVSKRLLHAQSLIANGHKPTEIYEQCGFSNYVSFYKSYLDFFGQPPSGKSKK